MAGKIINKTINDIIGGEDKERITFDTSDNKWKYSNDGLVFSDFEGGGDDGYNNYVNITQIAGINDERYVYESPSKSGNYRKPYGYNVGEYKVTYCTENGANKYISDGNTWLPLLGDGCIGNPAEGMTAYSQRGYNQWVDVKTVDPSSGLVDVINGYCKTIPAIPVNFDLVYEFSTNGISFLTDCSSSSELFCGPCFRELVPDGENFDSKMVCFLLGVKYSDFYSTFDRYLQIRFYDETPPDGTQYYFTSGVITLEIEEWKVPTDGNDAIFLRLRADDTNITAYISYNTNNNWIQVWQSAITSLFTSTVNQLGYVTIKKDFRDSPINILSSQISLDDYDILARFTANNQEQSSIYIEFDGSAQYIIDWGDGVVDVLDQDTTEPEHTYPSTDKYEQIWYLRKGDELSLIDFEFYDWDSTKYEGIVQLPNFHKYINLIYFALYCDGCYGTFPSLLNLINLQYIDIRGNFIGSFPDPTTLNSLEDYIISTAFSGDIPDFSQNASLDSFEISNHNIDYLPRITNDSITNYKAENLPNVSEVIHNFNTTPNLTELHLIGIPNLSGTLQGLVSGLNTIEFDNLGISGDLDFSNFNSLAVIVINNCPNLDEFISAPNNNVTNITVTGNSLTGDIPQFSCNGFVTINISNNSFTSISSDYSFVGYGEFNCSNNVIVGNIPEEFGTSSISVYRFNCSYNQFSGSIPTLEGSRITEFDCSHNNLSSIPNINYGDFSGQPATLNSFNCSYNSFSGSMPAIPENLSIYYCNNNSFTGSILIDPLVGGWYHLNRFNCSNNQLSGSLPNLSVLDSMIDFICNNNQITGALAGNISQFCKIFNVSNNLLSQIAIDQILYNLRYGGCTDAVISLNGTGNSAPSIAGLAHKSVLESRGCTVTTN